MHLGGSPVQKQVPAQSRGVSHYRRTLAASQRGRGLHLFTLNPEGEPALKLGEVSIWSISIHGLRLRVLEGRHNVAHCGSGGKAQRG
jgi:hypothetical protein